MCWACYDGGYATRILVFPVETVRLRSDLRKDATPSWPWHVDEVAAPLSGHEIPIEDEVAAPLLYMKFLLNRITIHLVESCRRLSLLFTVSGNKIHEAPVVLDHVMHANCFHDPWPMNIGRNHHGPRHAIVQSVYRSPEFESKLRSLTQFLLPWQDQHQASGMLRTDVSCAKGRRRSVALSYLLGHAGEYLGASQRIFTNSFRRRLAFGITCVQTESAAIYKAAWSKSWLQACVKTLSQCGSGYIKSESHTYWHSCSSCENRARECADFCARASMSGLAEAGVAQRIKVKG